MRITALLSTTAFVAGLVFATSASAQLNIGGNANVGVNVGIGGGGGNAEAGAGANVNANVTGGAGAGAEGNGEAAGAGAAAVAAAFQELDLDARVNAVVNLIANSDWATGATVATAEGAVVAAFNVGAWVQSETEEMFETTLDAYAAAIANLRAAVSINAELAAWLTANGISLDSVIALGFAAGGDVVVFTY